MPNISCCRYCSSGAETVLQRLLAGTLSTAGRWCGAVAKAPPTPGNRPVLCTLARSLLQFSDTAQRY
jgi:hypothetical protein